MVATKSSCTRVVAALACTVIAVASTQLPASRAASAPPEPQLVTLAPICAEPPSFLGRELRFRFQFESELATWNPYLTRFGSDDYRAMRVWSDEQMLWRREDWDAPLAVLFVRRGGDAAKALDHAPKYARFEVVGRVRQVFLGLPWIEIERAERLVPEIGEGALLHASRALQLMAAEHWQLAGEDLDRALIGNLPEPARAELLRLRDDCKAHARRL